MFLHTKFSKIIKYILKYFKKDFNFTSQKVNIQNF